MENKEANNIGTIDRFTTSSKGICILLVNNDTTCNKIVSDMLQHCSYEVLNSGCTLEVVKAIWEMKDGLELVLTNIHKLGFDGIEIVRHFQKKFRFPIVLMSPDKKKITSEKGQSLCITAYVLNCLSRNDVNNLWRNAFQKVVCNNVVEASLSVDETIFDDRTRKGKEPLNDYKRSRGSDDDEPHRIKKPRVVWTTAMHQKFLEAIEIIGYDRAVPKKIVEVMNVPGLTRENVASHLQKFRGGLKRAQEIALSSISDSFRTTAERLNRSPLHVLPYGDSFPAQTPPFTMQRNNSSLRSILDRKRYPKYHHDFSRINERREIEKLPNIYVPTDHSPSSKFKFVGIRLTSDGNSIQFGKLDASKEDQITEFSAPHAISGDQLINTGCVQQNAALNHNSSISENQSAQWILGNDNLPDETMSIMDYLSQDSLSLLLREIGNSSPGQEISGEAHAKEHIPSENETGFDDLSVPESDDFQVLLQDDISQQQRSHSPLQMLQAGTSDFAEQTEGDDSLINTIQSTSPQFDWERFCGTIFNDDG